MVGCRIKIINFGFQRELIRCDYKLFLELVIIYLGEIPPSMAKNGIHLPPPIAVGSARFMGRIIYSLEIQMFSATGKIIIFYVMQQAPPKSRSQHFFFHKANLKFQRKF